MVGPAADMMRDPTSVEPVKLTMSTSGESTRAAAGSGPEALTRLTTPGGNPTSSRIRTSSTMARGSWGAGLTTTVLPAASAGATLPAILTIGKLYEVTQATTPTGWRLTIPPMIPPGASGVAPTAWGSNGFCSDAGRVLRVALEANGRLGHLHARPHRQGGPGLGDHQREQLGRPGPDGLRGRPQEGRPLADGRGRPGWQRLPGRRRRGLGIGGAGVGGLAHRLLGRRVHDVVGAGGGVHPLATDQQLALVAGRLHGLLLVDLTVRHIGKPHSDPQAGLPPMRPERYGSQRRDRTSGGAP